MSSPFLSKQQIQKLWNAASFSIQEFNRPMNFGIRLSGTDDIKSVASALIHCAGQRLRYWSPSFQFPWILTLCRHEELGPTAFIAAGMPAGLSGQFEAWLTEYRANSLPYAVTITPPVNGERPFKKHFRLLAELCAATDPEILVRFDGERVPLKGIISLGTANSKCWLPLDGRRLEIAPCIGDLGQRHAANQGLQMISAFNDREFSWLKREWEMLEFRDRHNARQRRIKEEAIIFQKWPPGESSTVDDKRTRELQRLSIDPRQRVRSWTPWWLS